MSLFIVRQIIAGALEHLDWRASAVDNPRPRPRVRRPGAVRQSQTQYAAPLSPPAASIVLVSLLRSSLPARVRCRASASARSPPPHAPRRSPRCVHRHVPHCNAYLTRLGYVPTHPDRHAGSAHICAFPPSSNSEFDCRDDIECLHAAPIAPTLRGNPSKLRLQT